MPKSASIGALFVAARKSRDIPLEKAAHATRIHIQRLREIENDDFSHFTHPSYARMFLIDYAKYLGVPVSEIRDFLPTPSGGGAEGYQYLQESQERVVYRPIRPARQRRLLPVLLGATAIVVIAVGGFELALTLRKLDRLELGRTATVEPATPVAAPAAESAPKVEEAAPVAKAPVAAPENGDKPTVFAPPNIGVPVSIDQSVISSDESALNDASAAETPAEASSSPAPVTPAQSLPNGQAPGSPLFVGGTVEHGSTVQ